MPVLHLGVVDIPYNEAPAPKRARKASAKPRKTAPKPQKSDPNKTTGNVAEILEAKYGVMQFFFDRNEPMIADALADAVGGQIENLFAGRAPGIAHNAFGSGEQKIEERFRDFIDNREMDGQPGVPTEAAERGVNHRKKRPYVRRAARPSFLDTGLYQSSFKCWVD